MATKIRQNWDSVNDCPSYKRDIAQEQRAWSEAANRPIPEYRAKLVTLAHGQSEISITPVNVSSVINARIGFNPLLDCARKSRTEEEQAVRDAENRQRSAKRARQQVRYLVKSAQGDHMLTFSYRENVSDKSVVAADWKECVRLFRVRYPEWQYVAVLEKHDSEETSEAKRGSYHIHCSVHGRQDIKWLLRCWLLAIGQPSSEVAEWFASGVKLGEKSKGAVNVEAPKRRWGGTGRTWNRNKLAGYMTKYIGKTFDEAEKNAKKYWHSRNIIKPHIVRFWLNATNYADAVQEAHDLIYYSGATSLSMWGDFCAGVLWITGETDLKHIGQVKRAEVDFQ